MHLELGQFKASPRSILTIALLILLGFIFLGSFYQVQPEQVGAVTRFGQFVRISEAGLRLKMPFIEDVGRQ